MPRDIKSTQELVHRAFLDKLVGDEKQAEGIEPSLSPLDLIPYERAARLAGAAITSRGLRSVIKDGAKLPRIPLADESGAFEIQPLDMSQTARMARAKEMGFDVANPVYHGSQANEIQAFRPGDDSLIHFGTPEQANRKAFTIRDHSFRPPIPDGPETVYPVFLKSKNPLEVPDLGNFSKLTAYLHDKKIINTKEVEKIGRASGFEEMQDSLKGILKEKGYDSIKYRNAYETSNHGLFNRDYLSRNGDYSTAVFDPNQIRSKFADFDPSKSGSGNISSGIGAVGLGGGAAMGVPNSSPSSSPSPQPQPQHYDEGGVVDPSTPQTVLINSSTGLAEALPQDQADQALTQSSHEVPLNDPQGNPVTAPLHQARELVAQGYSQPSPQQLDNLLKFAKHSTPLEQLKTGFEGAASGMSFGLSTGAETALGVKPEDIQARREANPGTRIVGEMAGLASSTLIPGIGEARILDRIGTGAAKAAGFMKMSEGLGKIEHNFITQVGGYAIKSAVETGLVSTGDELSKLFSKDPHQTAETAMINIGMSALLSSTVAPIFTAPEAAAMVVKNSKLGQALTGFSDKIGEFIKNPKAHPEPFMEGATRWEKFKAIVEKKGFTTIAGEVAGVTAGLMGAHAMGAGLLGSLILEESGRALGGIAGEAIGKQGSVTASLIRAMMPNLFDPLMNRAANSEAFKSAVELGMAAKRAEDVIVPTVQSLFYGVTNVLPQTRAIKAEDREELKRHLDEIQIDPGKLMETASHTGYYLPEMATALSSVAARAVEYLQTLKPKEDRPGPLDSKRVPSPVEVAHYNRALDIAQQPLLVLQHVTEGSVVPSDILAIKTIYPALYDDLSQRLVSEMINHLSGGKSVPYSTRVGLSLFLGQPLDSTLKPSLAAAPPPSPPQGPPAPAQGGKSKGSMKSLAKLSQSYATPGQAIASRRLNTGTT